MEEKSNYKIDKNQTNAIAKKDKKSFIKNIIILQVIILIYTL